jgi:hypothetical protein
MDKFLPWGTKQMVISAMIDMLIEAVESHGPPLVGVLMSKEYNLITKVVKEFKNAP